MRGSSLRPGRRAAGPGCPAMTVRSRTELKTALCARDRSVDRHLPEMRASRNRAHAGRCVSVFLRLQRMWRAAQARAGRLLRVLLIRLRPLPADADGRMLHVDRSDNRNRLAPVHIRLRGCRLRRYPISANDTLTGRYSPASHRTSAVHPEWRHGFFAPTGPARSPARAASGRAWSIRIRRAAARSETPCA